MVFDFGQGSPSARSSDDASVMTRRPHAPGLRRIRVLAGSVDWPIGSTSALADRTHMYRLRCMLRPFAASLSVLVALTGCVAEVALPDGWGPRSSSSPSQAIPVPPMAPAPLPRAARLLSGAEYRRSVKDLLGVEVSEAIAHQHLALGYDTGANGSLQESVLAVLMQEAERTAAVAVNETLPQRFTCLQASPTSGCLGEVLSSLAARAWRRAVSQSEIDTLTSFATAADVASDLRAGLALAVARLILSPMFLYRSELGQMRDDGMYSLTASEQATLISYAVTGAGPDDALWSVVHGADGVLDDDTVRREAVRLVRSARGQARVSALMKQWVQATALDDMVARPEDFQKLASVDVARALNDGFDAFVTAVAFGDEGTLSALLTTRQAHVNRHTASLVGVSGIEGDALVAVSLPASERRGLLTQPGVLAAHGASGDVDKDRPVLRGFMMKTRLLCESLGAPSGISTTDAANAAASIPGFAEMTTREQYEAMMEQGPSCTACHAQFMPLGFSLGHYDALGQYRLEQRGRPIDASARGVPILGEERDFDDGLELIDALAREPAVAACFAQHVAAFVTGQGMSSSTTSLGRALAHDDNGRAVIVSLFVEAVVQSATLPRVRVEEAVDAVVDDSDGDDDSVDQEEPVPPVDPDPAEQVLGPHESLGATERRERHDGRFTFVYQGDGNVVLYESGVARWSSRTAGRSTHLAIMQGDGNFVVYARPGEPVFHTRTHGHHGAALFLRRSGVLEVRGVDGQVLRTLGADGASP
jgi:hypothetical protein